MVSHENYYLDQVVQLWDGLQGKSLVATSSSMCLMTIPRPYVKEKENSPRGCHFQLLLLEGYDVSIAL